MKKTEADDILYHYCSTTAFYSIVSNKMIRLSALSLSNDSAEGKVLFDHLREYCANKDVDAKLASGLKEWVESINDSMLHVGFCLSGDGGDRLSQWRGYADDAQGFSIGFSREYLETLAKFYEDKPDPHGQRRVHYVVPVQYQKNEQKESLYPIFDSVRRSLELGKNDLDESGALGCEIFTSLYSMKLNAFIEEKEVRVLSLMCTHKFWIEDPSSFYPAPNKLIPYRELEIERLPKLDAIKRVVIGPKNISTNAMVELFLRSNQFANVEVCSSCASYR
jgi:hypothetical protein